jgi:hypothetical protein
LILQTDRTDDIDEALAFAVTEFVRVFVFPTHCGLDRIAQLQKANRSIDGKLSPDLGLDAVGENFDYDAFGSVFLGHRLLKSEE